MSIVILIILLKINDIDPDSVCPGTPGKSGNLKIFWQCLKKVAKLTKYGENIQSL